MIANYHTHTARCRHAVGEDREYAAAAFAQGFQILGFSDHSPYWFKDNYCTYMRMRCDQLAGYCDSVRALREEYAGKMRIHLGLEAEYYPKYFPETMDNLRDAGIEYLILGQHWCNNEIGEAYNGRPVDDEGMLERYCDQVVEAMSTGVFTYVAHPDLFNYIGDPEIYQRHMERICRAAARYQIPLEINLLGLKENRQYPNPLFWQAAARHGCSVILGGDIHDPAHFDLTEPETQARAMAAELGLTILDTVEFRPL